MVLCPGAVDKTALLQEPEPWPKRLGDKLELLLAEGLRLADEADVLRGKNSSETLSTPRCSGSPRPLTMPDSSCGISGGCVSCAAS